MAGKKGRSGRKPKDYNTRQTQQTLQEAAVDAVKLIRDYVRGHDAHGNKVSITAVKLQAASLCISHAIGLPRQKLDIHHTGEQMSLKDLAMLAQSGETLSQNADKTGEKPFQNAVENDGEVVNVPTKPLNKTVKTSRN